MSISLTAFPHLFIFHAYPIKGEARPLYPILFLTDSRTLVQFLTSSDRFARPTPFFHSGSPVVSHPHHRSTRPQAIRVRPIPTSPGLPPPFRGSPGGSLLDSVRDHPLLGHPCNCGGLTEHPGRILNPRSDLETPPPPSNVTFPFNAYSN